MTPLRKLTRRQILAGLGGAGALAALSPFVPLQRARGVDGYPMRLVVFTTMMGMTGRYPDPWKPAGTGAGYTFPTGSILEPLAGFRDRMLVIDGLTNQAAIDTDLPGGHPVGLGTSLTGGPLIEGPGMVGGGDRDWTARTFGPSLDQLVASRLGARTMELGVDTRRRSLEATYKGRMSFRGPAEPVPAEFDPAAVFDRFFGGIGAADDPAAELRRVRRAHALDYLSEDLARVQGRLGGDDRAKIEAHLAALARVRAELDATPPETCVPPELGAGTLLPATARAQMQLTASAFACDITRVATIMWGSAPHGWRFEWLGTPISDGFHTLSHFGASNTAAQNDLTRACRWYAEQLRDFLEMLDAVPEGDGTLLDHTIVLWNTEVSAGNNHSFRNMPYVIAGGTGHFRSGRYLSFAGEPHNRLLVSLCHAMGLEDVDTFGDPAYGSGPLSGLV